MSNSPQQNSQVICLKNHTVELSLIVDDILELIESEANQQLNIEDRYATALGVERILRKHLAEEQSK
ncbi:hypothetical protein [Marinagarivorans cellulosilyticus]|uniref:hypothetical protein n=1 Tax=Marinagarivorans cellulosilyticus TaxID=2721545 RepID=UPI001F4813CB|nr:hypothetical protein [Marinagarivorans cellulosilyticus]